MRHKWYQTVINSDNIEATFLTEIVIKTFFFYQSYDVQNGTALKN